MKLKWIVAGQNAYAICPCCGASLTPYGRVERLGYLLLCNRCGIAVRRRTPLSKLQKKAVKHFWGKQIDS